MDAHHADERRALRPGRRGDRRHDLRHYINPSSPPDAANQPWNTRCGLQQCFGIAWNVDGLAPGQSVTLSSRQLPPGYSVWPGWFAAGTWQLYAYADSWSPGVASGAVAERDEANNRATLGGLTVAGANPPIAGILSAAELPGRPARLVP